MDAIIIGGGPAGISCAIWLKKLGVECVVLEASAQLGGLQTRSPYENLWIPGYRVKPASRWRLRWRITRRRWVSMRG